VRQVRLVVHRLHTEQTAISYPEVDRSVYAEKRARIGYISDYAVQPFSRLLSELHCALRSESLTIKS
jgi:hypothetical protein